MIIALWPVIAVPQRAKGFVVTFSYVWAHGSAALNLFLDYLNNLDDTAKIKFTMEVADENEIEFLDLKLKIAEGKINVDVYSKPTNSFTYVLPSTYYPYKIIRNVKKGIALRLRHICYTDEKYNQRSSEYKNHFISREYNPTLVKKQFEEVGRITRTQARASKQKRNQIRKINFFTSYNPVLFCMNTLINRHLPLLHSDDNLKTLFPTETFNAVYKRNKNLKELLTASLFPMTRKEKRSCVASSNTCDICKNYMVFSSAFVSTVTGKKYHIRGKFTCNSTNIIYLVECINCKHQYVGSATSFKQRFHIHKSDIKTKKDRCGTAKHFNSICCHPINLHDYLKVHFIEQVFRDSSKCIESI